MAKRRQVGNLLALAVLAFLTKGPLHPYELSRNLRDNGDARGIKFNHGSGDPLGSAPRVQLDRSGAVGAPGVLERRGRLGTDQVGNGRTVSGPHHGDCGPRELCQFVVVDQARPTRRSLGIRGWRRRTWWS
jgi:hypothetical protein